MFSLFRKNKSSFIKPLMKSAADKVPGISLVIGLTALNIYLTESIEDPERRKLAWKHFPDAESFRAAEIRAERERRRQDKFAEERAFQPGK